MSVESKICNCCMVEKPVSDYYIRKETGLPKNRCKRCCIDGVNMQKSDTHKICKHCGENKPNGEYQKAGGDKWLQPYCKPCDSKRKKEFYEKNRTVEPRRKLSEVERKQEAKARAVKYAKENRDKIILKKKLYYENNKDRFKEYSKKKRADPEYKKIKSAQDKMYREKNKEKVAAKKLEYKKSGRATETAKAWQAKQMNNPAFRIKKNLRGRIYVALKRGIKSDSTTALLGCSIEYFKSYFESLFTDGMSWDAYLKGEIHIDHIVPCKNFNLADPEQQKICFHYSNLQPLWELDNLKKGTSLNYKKAA